MRYLKQSTTVTIKMGVFVDATDGVTEETAITPVVEVSKDGGLFAARNSATAVAHDAEGWYDVELDATDTNTAGTMVVKAQDSATHLPVWHEFMVLPANVYDSVVDATDNLQVDAVQWAGSATAAGDVALETLASVVDGVWDEDIVAAHGTADTAGLLLRVLGDGISDRTNNATLNALLGVTDAAGEDVVSQILAGDTLAELAQAAPPATPTLAEAVMLLYMAMRNAETQSASEYTVSNDAGTVIAKAALSDDGTTVTKAEMATGP